MIATADAGVEVLSASAPLPFPIDDAATHGSRRGGRGGPAAATATSTCVGQRPQRGARPRSNVTKAARDVLDHHDFVEIETPTHALDARGRARLPGAGAAPARHLVRAAAGPQLFKQLLMVAGMRALLPVRAVLPRRGLPRRPAAGVHPARRRDELRRAGRRPRARRGILRRLCVGGRRRGADAVPADDVADAMRRTASDKPDCASATSWSSAPSCCQDPLPGLPGAHVGAVLVPGGATTRKQFDAWQEWSRSRGAGRRLRAGRGRRRALPADRQVHLRRGEAGRRRHRAPSRRCGALPGPGRKRDARALGARGGVGRRTAG